MHKAAAASIQISVMIRKSRRKRNESVDVHDDYRQVITSQPQSFVMDLLDRRFSGPVGVMELEVGNRIIKKIFSTNYKYYSHKYYFIVVSKSIICMSFIY